MVLCRRRVLSSAALVSVVVPAPGTPASLELRSSWACLAGLLAALGSARGLALAATIYALFLRARRLCVCRPTLDSSRCRQSIESHGETADKVKAASISLLPLSKWGLWRANKCFE